MLIAAHAHEKADATAGTAMEAFRANRVDDSSSASSATSRCVARLRVLRHQYAIIVYALRFMWGAS